MSEEAEITFWNSVKDSDDPAMLQAYLDRFPEGVFAPLAKIKLDKLYKVEGSQDSSIRTFEGHSSWGVSSVAFAPDGRTALSGSGDDTLKLWDVDLFGGRKGKAGKKTTPQTAKRRSTAKAYA